MVVNMSKTIGLAPLRDFSKYILYSGFVENAPRPVSGLIVAPPERGKSTEAQRWEGLGVITIQDLTSYGIDRYILNMSDKDREIFHHIVIPDLEKIGSRNRSVKEELLSKMRILMDEGLERVATGRDFLNLSKPLRLGFLMCTTPEDIGDRRSVFRSLSWQSRCIPFTYDFSDSMKIRILDFIEEEEHNIRTKNFFRREEKIKVTLPKHYAEKLTLPALILSKKLEDFSRLDPISKKNGSLIGIRAKENFMTFLKAIALYNGSHTVQKEHFEIFLKLFRWMNYDFNKIE
jgi:hypothetical protein